MDKVQEIRDWLLAGIEGAEVQVSGDGRHFEATIISEEFIGKSLIERHQMVYAVLGDKMQAEIHALSMQTHTPQEKAVS